MSRIESRSEILRPSEQPDTKPCASEGRRTRPWRVTSKKVLARKWRPPFFDDSARVCPQAYRTDRAGWSNRADQTDQTD